MNHALKAYQREALATLRDFWSRCAECDDAVRPAGIAQAFAATAVLRTVQDLSPYVHPTGLNTVPTVCLRIPTGGGKTFVAANACGVAKTAYLHREHPVIVWVAPSSTIVQQTIDALRAKSHPCHRALVDGSGVAPGLGAVRVISVDEALSLGPAAYAATTVVIVATVQQFRMESTDGRRVYEHNPALAEHPIDAPKSLVRVIAHHRPLVVVDEAHNVGTRLSFETIARLNPALVLEITATPSRTADNPSNVLYAASPLALFQESMIRLPIEVAANDGVDACLEWSLATRERLHALADGELARGVGSRMRPILLIQADATREGRITDDEIQIERKLIDDLRIPREQIAVHTGKRRDLDGVDLFAEGCPFTVIITKEALKEGWDCPWAFVLCTLRPSLTDKDAVQLVGRILRQYQAIRRGTPDLNKAFVAAKHSSIANALQELKGSLVRDLGYDEALAAMQVQGVEQHIEMPLGNPLVITGLQVDAGRAAALSEDLRAKVQVDAGSGVVTINATTSPAEDHLIAGIFARPMDAAVYAAAARRARAFGSGSDAGPALTVAASVATKPALRVHRLMLPGDTPGVFDPVGEQHFDPEVYRPSSGSALIDFSPNRQVMQRGRVGLNADRTHYQAATSIEIDSAGDGLGDIIVGDPTVALALFLRNRIAESRFLTPDREAWVLELVGHLVRTRGIPVGDLWADRYRLLGEAQRTINADLESACRRAIQQNLFDATGVGVSDDARDFVFDPHEYPAGGFDTSGVQWRRHFYAQPATMDSDNERACAMEIDRHPRVSTWVRNLVRHGYRIPRPPHGSRWFYPDFIVRLENGRTALVEHKGGVEQAQDVADKKIAGRFWAEHTGGLFVMTEDDSRGRVDFSELIAALSA